MDVGYSNKNNFFGKISKLALSIFRLHRFKKKENFDFSFSFIPFCNIINIFSQGSGKLFVTVHVNEKLDQTHSFYGRLYLLFIKYSYKKANGIIAVSKSLGSQIHYMSNARSNDLRVIYDPIDCKEIDHLSNQEFPSEFQTIFDFPVLINIGRLVQQKGHSHLLKIFRSIQQTHINTKLIILGEGDILDDLILLSNSLNLKTYVYNRNMLIGNNYDVFFIGFQKNPFKFLKASSLFLFPSLYEGFGISIVESMYCGTPVIASDCDFGPREILSPMSPNHFFITDGEVEFKLILCSARYLNLLILG